MSNPTIHAQPPLESREVRSLPVLLLALALVLGQVLLAAHQVEHLSAGEPELDCPLCLIGTGLDHAVTAAAPMQVLAPILQPLCAPVRVGAALLPIPPYQVRAPPDVPSTA